MNILIVAATKQEVLSTINYLTEKKTALNIEVDILITGVGMVATAFEMGKISRKKYDLAINAGIAGAFKGGYEYGHIVLVKEDYFAELGAEDHDNFLPIDDLGFGTQKTLPFGDAGLINPDYKKVKSITVNTVHGNRNTIEDIIKRFEPDIETMEGAAFFYSCNQLGLNCLQLRAISNKVEERNTKNWQIALAITALNNALISLLNDINKQIK